MSELARAAISRSIEHLASRTRHRDAVGLEMLDMGPQRTRRTRVRRTTRALTIALLPRSCWSRAAARLAARPRPKLQARLSASRERPPGFAQLRALCHKRLCSRRHASNGEVVISAHCVDRKVSKKLSDHGASL
jgi:hypothetical protein